MVPSNHTFSCRKTNSMTKGLPNRLDSAGTAFGHSTSKQFEERVTPEEEMVMTLLQLEMQ